MRTQKRVCSDIEHQGQKRSTQVVQCTETRIPAVVTSLGTQRDDSYIHLFVLNQEASYTC